MTLATRKRRSTMKTLILSLTIAMSLVGGISAASADNFPGYNGTSQSASGR